MTKIVMQVQEQPNGTFSVYSMDGNVITEGLQLQNYDVVCNRMAAERGGDWKEIAAEREESKNG